MKTSVTKISINEPCSQNWATMEKREKERFCSTCQKCVVDFSASTNAEIIQALSNATGKVCGRLTQTQLDQLNYHLVLAPAKRNWMKYLGILALGASIFAQTARAAVPKEATAIVTSLHAKGDDPKPSKIKRIYGYVFDEDKNPLVGIKVVISNTKLFAVTDKNGRYEIKLAEDLDLKSKQLKIDNMAYKTQLPLNYSKEKQNDMVLRMEAMIMGEFILKN